MKESTTLTVALQATPVYRVLSIGMVRVSTTEPLAVEVVVMGIVSVEISHTTSTSTSLSTALFTVMAQVRVRGVPAVMGEGGGVRETPGVGTVGYSSTLSLLVMITHLSLSQGGSLQQ